MALYAEPRLFLRRGFTKWELVIAHSPCISEIVCIVDADFELEPPMCPSCGKRLMTSQTHKCFFCGFWLGDKQS